MHSFVFVASIALYGCEGNSIKCATLVEYYKAHHGMDARKKSFAIRTFTIADNKVITKSYYTSVRIWSMRQQSAICIKFKIFVERAARLRTIFTTALSREEARRRAKPARGKRVCPHNFCLGHETRCMIYTAGIMIARAIILFIIRSREMLRCR